MIFCQPCKREGRNQVHHHFLEREEGGTAIPVCRWHWRGIPHPMTKPESPLPNVETEGRKEMGRESSVNVVDIKRLHSQGQNDLAIAEALHVEAHVVGYHRRKLGLKANGWAREKKAPGGGGAAAHKSVGRGRLSNERAAAASAGGDFRNISKHPAPAAGANGAGTMVSIRIELLDAIWAELAPEEKAQLVNYLVEARGQA